MFNFDGPNGVASKPSYGTAGTETWFTAGDPSASPPVPASNPGQDWFNMVQGELGAVLAGAGLARSKSNDAQVVAAIKALGQVQAGNYAADSGTANAMAVTLSPVPASLAALTGAPIRIKKIASANSGAVTLNVNGLGAAAVTWPDGSALTAGDLPAGVLLNVTCTGAAFVLMSQAGAFSALKAATGWVRMPNGLILQWGLNSVGVGTVVNFAMTFPNACLEIVCSEGNAGGSTWGAAAPTLHAVGSFNASGYVAWSLNWTGSGWAGGSLSQRYIAVGY